MKGRNSSHKINGNEEGNLLSSRGIMQGIVGTHAGVWTEEDPDEHAQYNWSEVHQERFEGAGKAQGISRIGDNLRSQFRSLQGRLRAGQPRITYISRA